MNIHCPSKVILPSIIVKLSGAYRQINHTCSRTGTWCIRDSVMAARIEDRCPQFSKFVGKSVARANSNLSVPKFEGPGANGPRDGRGSFQRRFLQLIHFESNLNKIVSIFMVKN